MEQFEDLISKFDISEEYIRLNSHRTKIISGVYFLISSNEIVYIGNSTNTSYRIADQSQSIYFDRYFVIQCSEEYHNNLTAYFILKFTPKLNKQLPKNDIFKTKLQLSKTFNTSVAELTTLIKKNKISSYNNNYYKVSDFYKIMKLSVGN